MKHESTNRLIRESSPYLLQHAHNPVDWYPWGDEALDEAGKQDRLMVISIGYSACHWCHVMEKESFTHPGVARIMNENYIPVKVDREERPDVDQVYMQAAYLITGSGGWPLNVIALPDGRPVYAGTYFPREKWLHMLEYFAELHETQPELLLDQAKNLHENMAPALPDPFTGKETSCNTDDIGKISRSIMQRLDPDKGGLLGAPKFPMPVVFDFLMEASSLLEDEKILKGLTQTLNAMAAGGIYDQLGGGFCRYSTDAGWKVPHFEKMLYDNAQLLSLYANAYKITKKPEYKSCIEQCITFIQEELKDNNVGYFSALDADTEGEEGKFYTWTYNEIKSILSEIEFEIAVELFNLKPKGNWEDGRNILSQFKTTHDIAEKFKLTKIELENHLASIRHQLKAKRDKRIKPGIDFKLITAHNAMLVQGFTKAFQATQNADYKDLAIRLIEEIIEHAINKDFSLNRLINKADTTGFLDDYAFTIKALIEIYQITFEVNYLKKAEALVRYVQDHFFEKASALFFYASDKSNLIVRKKEIGDNVVPSSNAIMAENLWVLGHLLSNFEMIEQSKQMVKKVEPLFKRYKMYFATWYKLKLAQLKSQTEIAVTGKNALQSAKKLQQNFFPITHFYGGNEENLPQLEHKINPNQLQFFVCKHQSCSQPSTNEYEFKNLLSKIEN